MNHGGRDYLIETVSYRLYPNSNQERALSHCRDLCRGLYNPILEAELENMSEGGKKRSVFDLNHLAKVASDGDPRLKRVLYSTWCDVAKRVHRALEGCFPDPQK